MEKVRIGIVGMGNMGKYHANYLIKGKVAHAELSAVCSTSTEKLSAYKDPVAVFGNGEEIILDAHFPILWLIHIAILFIRTARV